MLGRLYRSIPLIIAFSALLIFISALSPLAWIGSSYSLKVLFVSMGLGVLLAYCVTVYIEDHRNTKS